MAVIFYKQFHYLTKILSVLFLLSFGLNSQSSDNLVVASVGQYKIYKDQFVDRYTNYLLATSIKDNIAVREAILDNMINEILLYNYDNNENLVSNSEFQKELSWVEKQSVLAYLKDQEVYAKINVTEKEIREAFQRVNEKIAASHLYAPTLEEAENLSRLLEIGVDWDNLAAQVFSDTTLRNNGGYLGYFTWGDMDPAFEDAVYSLKIGEVSKPIKTSHGYSIIRLEDRISHPLLTEYEFQTKKNKLERVLKIKKKPEYEKKYLASIFNESKYTLNPKSVDNIIAYFGFSDINEVENTYQPNPQEVCASYDGKKFSEQFIIDQIIQIPNYHRTKIKSQEILKQVIRGIVIQTLLYSEAVNKGYNKNELVTDTADKLKMQVFLKYKMQQIVSGIQVSDSVLHDYYKNNLELFKSPNEISIQEIIVDNKPLSDSLINLLKKGNDFSKLAREYSLREFSKKNNGIIDYAPLSKFGFLKSNFWQAEIDEVIGPIELNGAFGIFKVLGKKRGEPEKYENINKDNIADAYKNDFKKTIMEEYLENIRRNVSISINLTVLNSLNILTWKTN
jgi:parvulin-like peptidyl-prolyl isomerase